MAVNGDMPEAPPGNLWGLFAVDKPLTFLDAAINTVVA